MKFKKKQVRVSGSDSLWVRYAYKSLLAVGRQVTVQNLDQLYVVHVVFSDLT